MLWKQGVVHSRLCVGTDCICFHYAFGQSRKDVVVPKDEIMLDDLVFNRSIFTFLGEAPFPPDQGLANGVSVKQESGESIRVFYPPYDNLVRCLQLDLSSRVINVCVGKWNLLKRKRHMGDSLPCRRIGSD